MKGEISKATAYSSIQKSIFEADRVSTSDAEKGFSSFIKAIENHNAEVKASNREKAPPKKH
jgi:hypothetical protein